MPYVCNDTNNRYLVSLANIILRISEGKVDYKDAIINNDLRYQLMSSSVNLIYPSDPFCEKFEWVHGALPFNFQNLLILDFLQI